MAKNKILVTGAAGYIGGTFTYEALKRGFNVLGIDNFSNSSYLQIEKIKKKFNKNFFFLKKDLLDNDLHKIDNISEVDAIFHFAALKSVPESENNPNEYFKNNVEGTRRLLNLMQHASINKLIFSSSAAVYGDQDRQPINELAELKPKSVYADTKKISEDILRDSAESNNLKVISLRYFNPLGSHKDKVISESVESSSGNIMSMILKSAIGLEKKIKVFGKDYSTRDGTGERDYIHINDIIEGHFKAYKKIDKIDCYDNFNLGTGRSISVIELLNTFNQVNNKQINYEFSPRRNGDLAICYADPSKANDLLEWEAEYSLEEMCKDAWEAIQNEPK